MLSKRDLFRICTVLFVIVLTCSIIRGHFVIRFWIYEFAIIGLAFLLYPKALYSKSLLCLFLYFFYIYFAFKLSGKGRDFILVFSDGLQWMSAIIIVNVYLYLKDYKGLWLTTLAGLIVIAIGALITIPASIIVPNIVREVVGFANEGEDEKLALFYGMGIVTYALVHAICLLIPVLVCIIKNTNSNKNRFYFLFFIVLCTTLAAVSGATTPLLLIIIGLLLSSLWGKNLKNNTIRTILVGGTVFLLFNDQIVLWFLDFISPFFENTSVHAKLIGFKSYLMFGSESAEWTVREELHTISINTFTVHPWLGVANFSRIGGHSYFIDRLALLGIIGCIPILLFTFFEIRKICGLLPAYIRQFYLLGISMFLMLGCMKNMMGVEYWLYLFIFLPGLSLYAAFSGQHIRKQ